MPERDSSSTSSDRGEILAKHLGIEYTFQNIAPTLDAIGCYQWRDDAILEVFPDYGEGWKNKIIIKGGIEGKFNHFALVVEDPNGKQMEKNLPLKQYLQIVAATNHKQRIRKALDYFHADRLHYAVVGTPNRVEFDQGFFVKNGDGSADLKPIAHLYKSQVYALARHMELPEEICSAIPTTDTYSLPQGQDEFYFALPYQQMDLALWAFNHDVSAEECAEVLGLEKKVVEYVYKDIVAKRNTTAYMHRKAVLIEPVSEITV
jgi:NAD+ synthase